MDEPFPLIMEKGFLLANKQELGVFVVMYRGNMRNVSLMKRITSSLCRHTVRKLFLTNLTQTQYTSETNTNIICVHLKCKTRTSTFEQLLLRQTPSDLRGCLRQCFDRPLPVLSTFKGFPHMTFPVAVLRAMDKRLDRQLLGGRKA